MNSNLIVALSALALAGCAPGLGPFRLAAADGRLVDRDSRAPIVGAQIFQVYRGGGAPGAEPRVFHSRWTETDGEGHFSFASSLAPSPRMWILETYGPRYDFYHPDYGLVRGPTTEASRVVLQASLDERAQRLLDLQAFCISMADDAASRRLREIACPTRRAR